jgi:hypothetical protein
VDVSTWAKSKRRFIRREELLAFLSSNSPGQASGGTEGDQDRLAGQAVARRPVQALPSLQVPYSQPGTNTSWKI